MTGYDYESFINEFDPVRHAKDSRLGDFRYYRSNMNGKLIAV